LRECQEKNASWTDKSCKLQHLHKRKEGKSFVIGQIFSTKFQKVLDTAKNARYNIAMKTAKAPQDHGYPAVPFCFSAAPL